MPPKLYIPEENHIFKIKEKFSFVCVHCFVLCFYFLFFFLPFLPFFNSLLGCRESSSVLFPCFLSLLLLFLYFFLFCLLIFLPLNFFLFLLPSYFLYLSFSFIFCFSSVIFSHLYLILQTLF